MSAVFPVILLHGLNSAETVLFATRALKDICRDNTSVLPNYAEGILSICHSKLADGSLMVRALPFYVY